MLAAAVQWASGSCASLINMDLDVTLSAGGHCQMIRGSEIYLVAKNQAAHTFADIF
jgi:hypothetical protein